MTVKELKQILEKYSDNALAMSASDSEQNTVSPLMGIESGVIGTKYRYSEDYVYEDGKDFEDFDFDANIGRTYLVLVPTL